MPSFSVVDLKWVILNSNYSDAKEPWGAAIGAGRHIKREHLSDVYSTVLYGSSTPSCEKPKAVLFWNLYVSQINRRSDTSSTDLNVRDNVWLGCPLYYKFNQFTYLSGLRPRRWHYPRHPFALARDRPLGVLGIIQRRCGISQLTHSHQTGDSLSWRTRGHGRQ